MLAVLFLAGTPLPAAGQEAGVTAFVNVHVLPMTGDTALPNRTVIVRNGRVAEIVPAARPVPRGARVIPGEGRWLLPALADMHVHMFDRGELATYLANGITTVLNLHGIPRHLAWRDSIARGWLTGPRIFTAGPIVDGDPPTRGTNTVLRTEEDVRREVRAQASAGYDFIKVYDNLSLPLYRVLVREAATAGLRVIGHVSTPVGLEGLLELRGQVGIQHVEELLPFFANDTAGLGRAAARLAAAGVWVTPTLTVFQSAVDQARDWPAVLARPAMRYLNPETAERWGWGPTGGGRHGNPRAREGFGGRLRFFQEQLVPALHRAGVPLLAGTDAPIPAIIPGFSLVDEIMNLHEAGLSRYEALAAATANPARFLGRLGEFGTIEPGAAADLLLVAGDPRADLATLRRPLGVMQGGRWHDSAALAALLEGVLAGRSQ